MIIPPRCFTCGNTIADKWVPYVKAVKEDRNEVTELFKENELDIKYIDVNKKVEKSIEGKILDEMGLHKYCCRIPFLTNVHLITSL